MTSATALLASIPGPKPLPIVGRTLNAWRYARDSIAYATALFRNYGQVVALAAGGKTNFYSHLADCPGTILAYGPDIVRQVTTQHDIYHKHPLTGTLYRYKDRSQRTTPLKHFGVGLFGINNQQHLQHRKLMMPAFHPRQIETYCEDMVAITQSMLEQVKCHRPFDLASMMRMLTLRIATKTLFGYDVNEAGGEIGQLLQNTLSLLGSAVILPFDLPGLPYHQLLNRTKQLDDRMRELIVRKQQASATTPDCGRQGTDDFLSLLISARDAQTGLTLTEEELLSHTGVLFAAGHETSANALIWTIFLLSQHPDITSALLDELQNVLNGEAPTVEQLSQLPWLDRVVKESLRVISPVPWNGRVTSQPTELNGYALPAGTEVMVSIYHTHHQSNLFPRPEKFAPERWEHINPSPYEYNPFSVGPRTCIGAAFATLEIKVVLAMLLQRYRLQLVSQHPINRSGFIVITPQGGMPVTAYPQDRNFSQGVGSVKGNVRDMVELP